MQQANLIEIFSSFQGEGPYIGEETLFVRFQDCALSCQYCDTPASFKRLAEFRVEQPPASGRFEYFANPVSQAALNEQLQKFPSKRISLTGGEPLQHADFLVEWLPQLAGKYSRLLETNGVLVSELMKVLPWIDVVSMDFKFPSATGMRAYWEEHKAFLRVARQKEVYVKCVVTEETTAEELASAVAVIKSVDREIPLVLQPRTPRRASEKKIAPKRMREFYDEVRRELPRVRVIAQMHPDLGLL